MLVTLPAGQNQTKDEHKTSLDATDLRDQAQDCVVASADIVDVDIEEDLVACKLVAPALVVIPDAPVLVLVVQ